MASRCLECPDDRQDIAHSLVKPGSWIYIFVFSVFLVLVLVMDSCVIKLMANVPHLAMSRTDEDGVCLSSSRPEMKSTFWHVSIDIIAPLLSLSPFL